MDRILLRLSEKERETLQLLNAALRVSEYTDDVDDIRRSRREDTMLPSMKEFFSAVVGLTLAASELPYATRKELENQKAAFGLVTPVLANAFEVARRHKRLNPNHNRGEYGKLVMILQDANAPGRLRSLGIEESLVKPITSVGAALEKIGASDMLKDELLKAAVRPILPGDCASVGAAKQAAHKELVDKYGGVASTTASPTTEQQPSSPKEKNGLNRRELVERCILSIADAKVFLHACTSPISRLLDWLDAYFVTDASSSPSLRIRQGKNGSCLSHDHDVQVAYVKESLVLWKIIQRDIFDFWECVENDMIIKCNGTYRFCDTGQGFHRMLSAPETYSRMSSAISEAHRKQGGWIGIKVVHLGDRDVPNALVFIDKYTIIPKMLTPIVQTIERIDEIFDESQPETHPGIRDLLKAKYGNGEQLKLDILSDFFKHAFDGSGDDGGNCIDGRLTSAWNWCHLLHKKPYYDAFVLTGFAGFDG